MAASVFCFRKNRKEKSKIIMEGTRKAEIILISSFGIVANNNVKNNIGKIVNRTAIIKFLL
ncbi:hypothetical protein FACS1894182_07130 [Bacteroidia bacterium]|nr:hypothetical protein FACS1894182_07130 [Bacteroidia bacterium]